ncbi:MYDGF factor, partial [Xiphorhynchus elegans]|nr:MYDGF factor [Xiphorhynchus elegans]
MAAPSGRSGGRAWAALVPAALLCLAARAAAEPGTAPGTAEFDVRPGGEVHSFSRSLGGRGLGILHSSAPPPSLPLTKTLLSPFRPQGKSYLFFTQFKAEVKGAKIEYAMAYSQAAVGAQNDIPLKQEEFEITETTVAHREGKFRFELSKLMIVAKTARDEL